MQYLNRDYPSKQIQDIIHQLELLMLLTIQKLVPSVNIDDLPPLKPDILDDLREGGIDTLGRYFPKTSSVIIDRKKCEKLDGQFGSPHGTVEKIVLIHELAHFVSHIGIGEPTKRDWRNFENAKSWDVERVAQAFTYLFIRRTEDQVLMNVFARLSAGQSEKYQQWEKDLSTEQVFDMAWGKAVIDLWKTSFRISHPDWEGLSPDDVNGILDV